MKKLLALITVVLLCLPILPVYADEDDRVMMIVTCPEQNFSTVCRPECTYDFTPEGGLTIWLGESADAGKICIFKTDAPGGDFAAETYFNNAYLELLKSSYGDNLIDPGEYTVYTFAKREMPGRMALYLKDGEPQMRFCLYDLKDDYFVRYEAYCLFDEDVMQSTIDDLSNAVRYLQPDAKYYSQGTEETSPTPESEPAPAPEPEPDPEAGIEIIYPTIPEEAEAGPNFKTVVCTAKGFSIRCGIYDRVEFKEHLGVTAFLESDGETIWVRINRPGLEPDLDIETYFRDEIDPEMQYLYKDNAYIEGEFTSFTIESKTMWGKEYQYAIKDYDYTRRVMLYQTEDEIVRFEAVYTQDTYKRVMYDLQMVVRTYQPDPEA